MKYFLPRISVPNEEMHFEIRILRTTAITYTCSVSQSAALNMQIELFSLENE